MRRPSRLHDPRQPETVEWVRDIRTPVRRGNSCRLKVGDGALRQWARWDGSPRPCGVMGAGVANHHRVEPAGSWLYDGARQVRTLFTAAPSPCGVTS